MFLFLGTPFLHYIESLNFDFNWCTVSQMEIVHEAMHTTRSIIQSFKNNHFAGQHEHNIEIIVLTHFDFASVLSHYIAFFLFII